MRDAMARHDRIVAACVKDSGGVAVGQAGDSVLAVFRRAGDAAASALAIQREFGREPWPPGGELKARISLHTGEAQLREGQYYGLALNRCARLLATGHGGQVLLTGASEQLLVDEPPPRSALWDLGIHRLKDLTRAEHVFQLVDLDHPRQFPPILSMEHQLTNLPAQLTSFVGRDDELRQLREMHHRARLLTVTGPGGAGKTRLALQLAAELVGDHADGVWLVELDPLSDPRLVPLAVAGGLGLKEQPGRRLADTLVDHARQRNLLLVLDNCEHVVESTAELAAELLKGCEGVSVLATSREPLKVPGELTWRVPPLTREEAVRLFADRATSHDPAFTLSDENVETVARICERLDWIPLAIELAAARVTMMPVGEILNHLESRFSLLTAGDRTMPGRLKTLKAAMDWSYDLLAEPEKLLFRRVSIFSGRFSLGAVEAVCNDTALPRDSVLGLVGQLVDKSLLTLDETRYHCLETIRAYGRERLAEGGDLNSLHARLGSYVLGLAQSAEPGHLAAWLDRLEAAHDDIRSTLTWVVTADPELGTRLAAALFPFWQLRGHAAEPRHFAQELLERTSSGFPQHAAALHLAGAYAYLQSDLTAAHQLLDQALQEARAAGDQLTVMRALDTIGLVAAALDDLTRSEAALEEGLTLARELGERNSEAAILHQLGLLASRRGHLREARSLLEKSIEVRRALGRNDEISMSLTFLAAAKILEGDPATARKCIAESFEIGRALSDRRAAWSLDVLACLTALEGRPEQALQLAGAGAAIHASSGITPAAVWKEFMSMCLQPARAALGPEAATIAWESGMRMTFDGAMAFAMARDETQQEQSVP
jgi:predicted ATPase